MTAPTTRAKPKIALDQRAASRHDGAARTHDRTAVSFNPSRCSDEAIEQIVVVSCVSQVLTHRDIFQCRTSLVANGARAVIGERCEGTSQKGGLRTYSRRRGGQKSARKLSSAGRAKSTRIAKSFLRPSKLDPKARCRSEVDVIEKSARQTSGHVRPHHAGVSVNALPAKGLHLPWSGRPGSYQSPSFSSSALQTPLPALAAATARAVSFLRRRADIVNRRWTSMSFAVRHRTRGR